VLNRMARLGLVERVRLETDGRIRRIRLTASGRMAWQEMLVDIRGFYAVAIADFATEDAEQLFVLLDRLTAKLSDL